jgi:hypothetical protein
VPDRDRSAPATLRRLAPRQQDSEIALYELFFNKEELLPLWLRLRPHIEAFGDDVKIKLRERYAVALEGEPA